MNRQLPPSLAGVATILGPTAAASEDCERVLRSLPLWFGREEALLQYVRDTREFPTFVVDVQGRVAGFLTVREHFPECWEVHCVAMHAEFRNQGLGRRLHAHAEDWIGARGGTYLQVKTLAASNPSPEYAETRAFYAALGYAPLEVFPTLWGPDMPVLQLIKNIHGQRLTP